MRKNFDPNNEIKVILAAGIIRVGKSTFLNILRYLLADNIDEDAFSAKE